MKRLVTQKTMLSIFAACYVMISTGDKITAIRILYDGGYSLNHAYKTINSMTDTD